MLLVLQAITTALLDAVDELLVRGIEHALPEGGFFRLLRLERIEERFVLARGVGATLHTQLFHGADKTVTGRRHTNGAHQARLVGIDLISRTGDVIGTRSAQIGNHRIELGVRVQATQTTNLVIDITRLHRTAARAVDAQDDALDLFIFESGTQAADDIVGAGRLLVGDHAGDVDQCGVIATAGCGFFHVHQRREQQQRAKQVHKGQQLEENPPASGATLFLHTGQQGLFQ
ncbi:hypothetical protein D3C71_1117550 [compost metagenome]